MSSNFTASRCITAAALAALVAGLAPAAGNAKPLRRHKAHATRHVQRPYAAPYYVGRYGPASEDPYSPYAAPGAAIRAQARINQNAPGLTNELAPGNIATATGGPSGGVPGFSGH